MRKIPLGRRAFSLIELVAVLAVLGICLAPLSVLLVNVVAQHIYAQAWVTAVGLAEQEMERVGGTRFSALTNETSTFFASPFNLYTKQVIVDYVNATDLTVPAGSPTDYKRVQVNVNNTISGNVTLTTLVANNW